MLDLRIYYLAMRTTSTVLRQVARPIIVIQQANTNHRKASTRPSQKLVERKSTSANDRERERQKKNKSTQQLHSTY